MRELTKGAPNLFAAFLVIEATREYKHFFFNEIKSISQVIKKCCKFR